MTLYASRRLLLPVAALLAALLGACASYDGRGLVPGRSTAAEVENLMGTPAEKLPGAAGDTVWFYPRNPSGRHTYAVSIDAKGVLRGIEQTLTMDNIGKIVAEKSTPREVRALLGPPNRIVQQRSPQREVWEYRMFNPIQVPYNLYVQYSNDGLVREVLFLRDPSQDIPSPRS